MKLARVLLVLLVLFLNVTALTEAGESNSGRLRTKSAATQAEATVLFDIEIERAAEETKVYLKADGAIKAYREVKLKKNIPAHRPDRMYLDLKDMHLAGPIPVKMGGAALARVRNARRPDGLRVVFDSNLDRLFNYTINEQSDGLLVTIREASGDPAVIADLEQGAEPGAEPEKVTAPEVLTIQPEPKAAGDLGLVIVTTDRPEQTQEWLDSSPDSMLSLHILKTAKPDQEINISFLVTGVTSDRNGDYAVVASFVLLDPSGRPMFNKRRFAKMSGRAPASPAFIMAEPGLDIILGESDPVGEYTIIGIVEDLINYKMSRTSLKLTLEK
ncbi:MAG: AMIN domain-containing protein [Proteobacteria bacterium]|nr:AMIN domain-containing protein [Pseudomonadota bacterium]MBU1714691.1 AMIN domain-containing protein [Pseudomonadota bacterium]